MKFIPSRDLRIRPGRVWKDLKREKEIIVTNHGQPVAMMVPVNGDDFEETLAASRRARLLGTIRRIQAESARKGLDKITPEEIDQEIRQARKSIRGTA